MPKPLSPHDLDQVVGGALQGIAEAEVLLPVAGNDLGTIGAGSNVVYGGAGDDVIHTGAGNDLAFGGAGDDTINGGAGQDQLYGEAGNDILDGGAADGAPDLAFGGTGDDSFVWSPGDGNDHFQGGSGNDTLKVIGMSLQDLQSSLQLEGDTNLQMQVDNNTVTFTDASGNPATFGGTINFGGETMRFAEVEQIRLL